GFFYLCFDSDVASNPHLAWAEWHLAQALQAKGAIVQIIRVPSLPDGSKCGVDDFLVANGPDAFDELMAAATGPKKPDVDVRPKLILSTDERRCVKEAAEILVKHDSELFQRGRRLVRIVYPVRPPQAFGMDFPPTPAIERIPEPVLRLHLTEHAH